MIKKIADGTFLVILFLALWSVPIFWLARESETFKSTTEARYLNTFSSVAITWQDLKAAAKRLLKPGYTPTGIQFYDRFLERSYQKAFEAACTDQFPLRFELLLVDSWVKRSWIQLAYAPLNDPIIPASTNSTVMELRNTGIFMWQPSSFGKELTAKIDQRIANFNQIIQQNPTVNFFVLYVEESATAKYNPASPYFPLADQGQAIQYFEENKPKDLILAKWTMNSMDEYKQYFFKTDHHWNARGSWRGYEQIYHMLQSRYPQISPMLKPDAFLPVPGVKFCGSFARTALAPCQPEAFEYVQVQLPPYYTYVNGFEQTVGKQAEFLAGDLPSEPYANIYGDFWGEDVGLIWYHYDNGAERNLLLISDSFSNSIDALIASHYRDTFVIDLRMYKDFSLSQIIAQYHIDDVLVLGSQIVLFSKEWTITP